ncbi:MAG: rplW [Parcubacteria group bacterium]|nr:rplW [Parcubacteria group bacterium]
MAILGTKKNTKEKAEKIKSKEVIVAEKANKASVEIVGFSHSPAILKPRITEKSGDASQKLNAYTFEISRSTSKNEVAKAIKELYKVAPLKINVINLPRKRILSRGKKGWSGGVKKAVVYLKKDDKIEFI